MSELFSIQLQNRQQQGRDGVWLDLPTTTEQVQAALRQIGISPTLFHWQRIRIWNGCFPCSLTKAFPFLRWRTGMAFMR